MNEGDACGNSCQLIKSNTPHRCFRKFLKLRQVMNSPPPQLKLMHTAKVSRQKDPTIHYNKSIRCKQ